MPFGDLFFQSRWRSGMHIGSAKPYCIVQIQQGKWTRNFNTWVGNDVSATIPGESKRKPWFPKWTAQGAWIDVPGVSGVRISNAFDQNGLPVATIDVENVRHRQMTGTPITVGGGAPLDGVYYAIERGFLSPLRGYRAPQRPASVPQNEWFDVLSKSCRIRIWQGLGAPTGPTIDESPNGGWTFNGLIEDIDLTNAPATVSITAQMGKMLTDSRLFGWNKSRQLKDPIIFCDRLVADGVTRVGTSAAASSQISAYPASNAIENSSSSSWRSSGHNSEAVTEWIEIRVPKGRYTSFVLDPAYDGMEMYVGFFVRNGKVDGTPVSNGWVGSETVPGANGGWAYIRKAGTISSSRMERKLGAEIECGDNSILRIGFRRLQKRGQEPYRAGVTYMRALKRSLSQQARDDEWILIDDLADMVKVVLRWAGFDEWVIESTGVRLNSKVVYNRTTFLMDIINKATEDTGWTFHLGLPSSGESWGIPTWTSNASIVRPQAMIELRDDQMLTGVNVKISEEPLPYIIRVRGKPNPGGASLGATATKAIMAVYRPPWWDSNRLSGIIKHSVVTRPELSTYEDCAVACYLIAINAALQAVTATCETLCNPAVALNQQVSIIDKSTGMNSRLYVSNWEHNATYTEDGSWKMAVGGSMIDTPDIIELIRQINAKGLIGRFSPVGRV